jgi:hypothetical protein
LIQTLPSPVVNRLMHLEEIALTFFNRHHSQEVEGEFDGMFKSLRGFSGRRNDVAHAIDMPVQRYDFFSKTAEQCRCDIGTEDKPTAHDSLNG